MKPLPTGMRRAPWGFFMTTGGLVANTSAAERYRRAELGEFAIRLLGLLGVTEQQIATIEDAEDPIAALQRLREVNQ